jgi:hypothetical protein
MCFTLALASGAAAASGRAQDAAPQPCDGKIVSRIDIRRSERTVMDKQRAPAWARAIVQPLLVGSPTRAGAIAPWLMLSEGKACSELRRRESERLLRLLPYIADATVRAVDDGSGGVRIDVETTDDIRPIIGIGLRESKPNDIELGSTSIDGSGHLAALRWRDGGAFRDGLGARYTNYRFLGGPNVAQLAVTRAPLGNFVAGSAGRAFFSDVQTMAAYAGYLKDEGYFTFVRPEGDALSLQTSRERADAGVAFRLNTGGTVRWLVGTNVSLERRSAGDDAVIILNDRGIVDTANATLRQRFTQQRTTRAGLVLGARALTFVRAVSFDGLEAAQDIARGAQLATTIGKGITGDDRSPFVVTDFYAGVGGEKSFAGLRVLSEARQDNGGWGRGVISGRAAWYTRPTDRQTRILAVEFAGASTDSVPYQLTIGDGQAGVRGYSASRMAGARRVVFRGERRIIFPGISRYLGWGAGVFGDAGMTWAGNVPFGRDATRASLGLSVLAAVPRNSRSLARVDVAYPLVRDSHAKGAEVRVSFRATPRVFWREPVQIARARLATPSTDIFGWP